jgi:hypothetical protein
MIEMANLMITYFPKTQKEEEQFYLGSPPILRGQSNVMLSLHIFWRKKFLKPHLTIAMINHPWSRYN